MELADAQLVERCRHRDTAAFGELVERHQRLVFGVALARCRDAALAEDVAQEAFVTAWQRLDRLDDAARVGSWVAGIARNLAASAARSRARRAAVAPTHGDPILEPPVPTPHDAAVEREDRELLARALEAVPAAHREALVLFYLQGKSIAAIARSLAISEELVKQRLSRGRRALREGVANRVEVALVRVRDKPGLRAGVIAAIAAATVAHTARTAGAATTTGKAIGIMTMTKLAIGVSVVAAGSAALWVGLRSTSSAATEASARTQPAIVGATSPAGTVATLPALPATGHAQRIDAHQRAALLDQIRAARERASASASASHPAASATSPSPGPGDRPALPPDEEDKAYIRDSVRAILPMLGECYGSALERDPKLAGRVTVSFTIEGDPDVGGVVTNSEIDPSGTTIANTAMTECLQQTMYGLELHPPSNGGSLAVTYPFEFSSAPPPDSGAAQ